MKNRSDLPPKDTSLLIERAKMLSLNIEQSAHLNDWFELGLLLNERDSVLQHLTESPDLDRFSVELARIVEIDSRTVRVIASKKRALAETLCKLTQFERAKQISLRTNGGLLRAA